jgi:predicted short-subunit dehydrogenase-like oxidoreductase (DUF2520 family)
MASRKQGQTVTLVGAGNLAHALAELLPPAGYNIVEIVTRSNSARARALGRKAKPPATTIAKAHWSGDIVWLAVSDGAIRELASSLAPVANWKGKIVLHSSGALSSRELAPLRRAGARVASVHPMMTFVPGRAPDMAGVVWTVEGDPSAVKAARRIVTSLRGHAIAIDRKHKPLYHAFGAFLSPLLIVHLETASRLAQGAGIPRRGMDALMKPIVEQTLANLWVSIGQQGGAGKAFSGPLIRGDVGTIQRHLKSLKTFPAACRLYEALVSAAVQSQLPVKNRRAIAKLLSKSR